VQSEVLKRPPSTFHPLYITFDNQLALKLLPSARIIVWFISASNELVSDALEFAVLGTFANQV
jgi:hypothetical protein